MFIVFWVTLSFIIARVLRLSPLGSDIVTTDLEVTDNKGDIIGTVTVPIPVTGTMEAIQNIILFFSVLFQAYHWITKFNLA
jgi:hypothetical protein